MNDIFQQPVPPAFAPQPGPLLPHQAQPAEPAPASNGKKGRRGPRKPKEAAAVVPAAPKKGRPRKATRVVAATPARAASTVRLDLAVAIDALIGLTADEAKLVSGIVSALQVFKTAERAKILGAVNKVLA